MTPARRTIIQADSDLAADRLARRDNIAALIIIGAAFLLPTSLVIFFFILFFRHS